uniref:aECM cysteine-cradle domain-containing protein n=1 Tax=Parascaris equorum TaxID=6256 RepID=A0A914S9L4_PAREQ
MIINHRVSSAFSVFVADEIFFKNTALATADGMQLSRAQCEAIRKFARVFQMANPAEWVRENCPFAKQYFPRASCSQIQLLFESCMLRT